MIPVVEENINFPLDCGTQIIRGGRQERDIPQGGEATITCTNGGCLHFKEVVSEEHPRPHHNMFSHQAMFGCNNDKTMKRPNAAQKKMNEKQLKFMKEKCEGKDVCSAKACDSWWSTNLKCSSREAPIMKLIWHCHGGPGPKQNVRIKNNGRCEAGVWCVKIMVSR